MRESEKRYRALFEQAADAIAIIDPQSGALVEFNQKAHENLGYTRQEFESLKIPDFEVVESDEQVAEHITKIVKDGSDTFETKHRTKSGEIRDILVNARALPIAGRYFIQCIATDITDHERAHERLRLSEELLRIVLNAVSDSVYLIDLEGIVLAVNQAGASSLGTFTTQLVGRNVFDFFPPEVANARRKRAAEVRKSGRPLTFQDRRCGWVFDCRFYPVLDEAGSVDRIAVFIRDVTEQQRAHAALKQSEERYRSLSQRIPCMVYRGEVNWGAEVVLNCEPICGYTPQELISGRINWLDIIHPDDRDRVIQEGAMVARRQMTLRHEYRIIRKDGVVAWVADHKSSFFGAGEELEAIDGVVYDITELRHTEEALRESERRYRAVFDGSAEGILVADLETKVFKYANPAICGMLGYSQQELVQMAVRDIHPNDDLERVLAAFDAMGRGNLQMLSALPCLRKDGTVFPADINVAPTEIDGRPCNVAFFTDVTERVKGEQEREQLEEQLRHSQKMDAVGQLAAGVAHEFNNLLVGIIGNAELVVRSADRLPDGVRVPIEDIRRSGERAAALTQQLLTLSKKRVSSVTVFDASHLVARAEYPLRQLMGPNMTMRITVTAEPCPVRADEAEFEQILANLIVNARDAVSDGGTVTVGVTTIMIDESRASQSSDLVPGPHVELSVTDTGCGMSEETVERIFEPFFTTKPGSERAGLGLAMVFSNVKRASGSIAVNSRPGEGTTFRIYFPRADGEIEAQETPPDSPLEGVPRGNETILVCDDEDVVLRSLCWLLESGGYSVIAAESGRRALELASAHEGPISVLLTDVIMPEMNGRQLADLLTRRRPEIRVIYMSGYASDVLEAGRDEGESFEFLQKPSTGDALLRRVREVIDKGMKKNP